MDEQYYKNCKVILIISNIIKLQIDSTPQNVLQNNMPNTPSRVTRSSTRHMTNNVAETPTKKTPKRGRTMPNQNMTQESINQGPCIELDAPAPVKKKLQVSCVRRSVITFYNLLCNVNFS